MGRKASIVGPATVQKGLPVPAMCRPSATAPRIVAVVNAQVPIRPAVLTPVTAERPGNSSGLMPMRASHQKVSDSPSKVTDASINATKAAWPGESGRHREDAAAGECRHQPRPGPAGLDPDRGEPGDEA